MLIRKIALPAATAAFVAGMSIGVLAQGSAPAPVSTPPASAPQQPKVGDGSVKKSHAKGWKTAHKRVHRKIRRKRL